MKMDFSAVWVCSLLMGTMTLFGGSGQAQTTTAAIAQHQDLQATRELMREIQFMLLRLGLDPGPLDGLPRNRTNRAVRLFEQIRGLPLTELKRGGKVSAEFVARLRDEAARAMLDPADMVSTGPRSSSPPTAPPSLVGEGLPAKAATDAIAPALLTAPSRDPFASCTYDPEDFHIGPNRYTPDTFLKEGFDGLTARAVGNLQDRLEEGRRIADRIGVSALHEVQRQARVLQYFECRLQTEQASGSKN